jgi:hypothetical protein
LVEGCRLVEPVRAWLMWPNWKLDPERAIATDVLMKINSDYDLLFVRKFLRRPRCPAKRHAKIAELW